MSYFSNILTATKTRYATLRGADEIDGDTEDDSHISRVLRNYYTEAGRPTPDWLGGGPPPAQSLRNNYGSQQGRVPPGGRGNVNASLSDIWDSPGPQGQQFNQQAQPGGRPRFGQQNSQNGRPNPFPGDNSHSPSPPPQIPQPSNSQSGNLTAQQRIKERLWGGRTASPPPNAPSKQQPQQPMAGGGGGGRYDNHGQNGGGALDPRAGGSGGKMSPGPSNGTGYQNYNSHPTSGGAPYVGAGMPWDDGGHSGGSSGSGGKGYSDGYAGGGSTQGNLRRPGGGRVGLPTGPGMMRQQGGGY